MGEGCVRVRVCGRCYHRTTCSGREGKTCYCVRPDLQSNGRGLVRYFVLLEMFWIILLILLPAIIIAYIDDRLVKITIVNIGIIVFYNTIGWIYVLNNNMGGASLGPGLLLIFVTGIHVITLTIYNICRVLFRKRKPKDQLKLDADHPGEQP